jgi:thiol-disulfide isomerase/thioredoxin
MVRSHPAPTTTADRRPRLILAAVLLFGCKELGQDQPKETPQYGGWYRAVLLQPGSEEVPFFLSLPADPTRGGAVVLNGKHWFSAPHTWQNERVEVDFAMYRTKILASVGANQNLIGTWEVASRAWGTASIPFRATRIEEPDVETKLRSADSPAPEVDPSGVWSLSFASIGPGKLVLEKEGVTAIGGTLWYAGAETAYLSGNVIAKRVVISGFDGASPYLLSAEISGDTFDGEFTTGADLSFREKVSGKRLKKDFEIEEPVRVSSPDRRLRLPELDHPRYAGQPVIVQIAGSWCTHCKLAAPVMLRLYEAYHAQDLKILTINYELTPDKSYNLQRAAHFKNEYGITWQLVTREGTVEEIADLLPAGLAAPRELSAFPITVFLKRDHTVHRLHSGFVGPESGPHHSRLVEKFETWTKEILK